MISLLNLPGPCRPEDAAAFLAGQLTYTAIMTSAHLSAAELAELNELRDDLCAIAGIELPANMKLAGLE